jgi:predicted phage baseplate assembly protein
MELRGGNRAVTAGDFELHTLAAIGAGARARCLPPDRATDPVRVLVVPPVDEHRPETLTLAQLDLSPAAKAAIGGALETRRLLTTRVLVDVPEYQGVTVEAEVQAAPTVQPETVRREAASALYAFINPLTGGPDGTGWPFDLDLYVDDVRSVLRSVPGVVRVVECRLLAVDLHGRLPDEQQHRLSLPPDALFLSVAHRVVARP